MPELLCLLSAILFAFSWCWASYDDMIFHLACAQREFESAMFDVRWNCADFEWLNLERLDEVII